VRYLALAAVMFAACASDEPQHRAHTVELVSDCGESGTHTARYSFPDTTFELNVSGGCNSGTASGNAVTGVEGTQISGPTDWTKLVMYGFEHSNDVYYSAWFSGRTACLALHIGEQQDCTSRIANPDGGVPIPGPDQEVCSAQLTIVQNTAAIKTKQPHPGRASMIPICPAVVSVGVS
jgi:hypothetical protein